MLAVIAFIAGLGFGWFRAARRGGDLSDKLQYAVAHGFAFGLAGFAVAILVVRSGLF